MTNTNEQEIWKVFPDYPFIEASNLGRIRTVDRVVTYKNGAKHFYKGHILKQYLLPCGYLYVVFKVNGKTVHLRVHRVVAASHLPNPDNLPEVNHKDNDPTNNRLDNLEWCDHQYNIVYREKHGKSAAEAVGRPVYVVNLETGKVLYFESQSEAARQLGVDQSSVNMVVRGQRIQAGGYLFTEDESEITEEKIQEVKAKMKLCSVIAINTETSEAFLFKSQSEAARQLGVSQGNVNNVLKGRYKKTKGYWFCYADENAVKKVRVKFGDKVARKVEELMREHRN